MQSSTSGAERVGYRLNLSLCRGGCSWHTLGIIPFRSSYFIWLMLHGSPCHVVTAKQGLKNKETKNKNKKASFRELHKLPFEKYLSSKWA